MEELLWCVRSFGNEERHGDWEVSFTRAWENGYCARQLVVLQNKSPPRRFQQVEIERHSEKTFCLFDDFSGLPVTITEPLLSVVTERFIRTVTFGCQYSYALIHILGSNEDSLVILLLENRKLPIHSGIKYLPPICFKFLLDQFVVQF